jgi:hypothetical protein
MKTFTIIGKRELVEYVTYTVEAESEEEALELIQNEDIEDNDDHWVRETGGGMTYEIQKERTNK